jgi:hypothetical protein
MGPPPSINKDQRKTKKRIKHNFNHFNIKSRTHNDKPCIIINEQMKIQLNCIVNGTYENKK